MLQRLCRSDSRWIQAGHLAYQVFQFGLDTPPGLKGLSGNILGQAHQALKERVLPLDVLQQSIEPFFVWKVGDVSAQDVSPGVFCVELVPANVEDHLARHDIYHLVDNQLSVMPG